MNKNQVSDFIKLFETFNVANIEEKTRFWLLRTKKGYFYDEFVKSEFVALGWNVINATTDLGKDAKETIKEIIGDNYPENTSIGFIINKCVNFIREMKTGDYVIFPSAGSKYLTIAIVGEYYEEGSLTVEKEVEINRLIEHRNIEVTALKCPYMKRRKIQVLKTVAGNCISYNLYKGLRSYHGISSMDEYAVDILNLVYNMYSYEDNLQIVINVNQREALDPIALAEVLQYVTKNIYRYKNQGSVTAKMNLNSPGEIIMQVAKGGIDLATNPSFYGTIFLIWVGLGGGKAFGFEIKSIPDIITDIKTRADKQEQIKLMTEKMKIDNQILKNNNELKELELFEKKIELNRKYFDVNMGDMKNLQNAVEMLDITPNGLIPPKTTAVSEKTSSVESK